MVEWAVLEAGDLTQFDTLLRKLSTTTLYSREAHADAPAGVRHVAFCCCPAHSVLLDVWERVRLANGVVHPITRNNVWTPCLLCDVLSACLWHVEKERRVISNYRGTAVGTAQQTIRAVPATPLLASPCGQPGHDPSMVRRAMF